MIRIGICADFEFVPEAVSLGFDYLELSLREVAALSESEFDELLAYIEYHNLKIEVLRDMLPDDLRITGENVSARALHDYLAPAFDRARRLGAQIVVMDALASRRVPYRFDFAQAARQLDNFLRLAQGHANDAGLSIALKGFRRAECNLLNHVSEASLMCALLQLKNLGVAADTVQMALSAEALDTFSRASDLLLHVHTGNALTRTLPASGDGENYERIFSSLKDCGYDGRISCISAEKITVEGARNALARLRAARQFIFGH